MKQKIIIIGGLGYIGAELCKLYSGEARYKNITIVDSRFTAERVKQLTSWGIKFVQGDILDAELLKNVLQDADIVYHLAGITNVPQVQSQENAEKNEEIRRVGIDGTRNILSCMHRKAKIIFPSTHVIFEGLTETKFDIGEYDVLPCPKLTYATGKAISESDITISGLNYVIVRLGSVYGYSESDNMRINIMPNFFSKVASQNGTIKLFSGGCQYKSLVNVVDVARGMKFLAESNFNGETFNLCNENLTTKDVAEICKKVNPKVELIETADAIPNNGYTLSNKKLLNTGFKFLYNLETSLREMIANWSEKKQPEELEYIVKGGKEFVDERGKISNYELTEPINLIGLITSKKGAVRANHFHPIQEQKCLLVSGKYISVTKDLADPNAVLETRLIQQGDLAVIRPNVAHTMVFLEDSTFLNLVRGEREHENYGITHTIPYKLVNDVFRYELMLYYKCTCRACGGSELKDVLSLGLSPLANNLANFKDDITGAFPLELKYCPACHNVQLSFVVPPELMFDTYLYQSSTAASFRKHFEDAAKKYVQEFSLGKSSLVFDLGSNDGIALRPLKEMGVNIIGVEPAKNIADIANDSGITTINKYFDYETAREILNTYGEVDIVTASNVFAHSDKLATITEHVFAILKSKGVFIIEVQYLVDTLRDLTFDNIYHEHVNYWSVTSLVNFFCRLGLCLYKVEHIDTHGGSIRCYISRENEWFLIDESVNTFLNSEKEFGIENYETYKAFARRVNSVRVNVLTNIKALKSKYKRIAAYGSPAKATTALNYFGIDSSIIEYTVEDNQLKHGKFIPVVHIPIVSKHHCIENPPDAIIVLAWNFFDEIVKNNKLLIESGVKFISIKDLQNIKFNA